MKHILVGLLVLLFALPAMAGPVISKPGLREPANVVVKPIIVPPCGVRSSETINGLIYDALCCQAPGDEARIACLDKHGYAIQRLKSYTYDVDMKISNSDFDVEACTSPYGPNNSFVSMDAMTSWVECEAESFASAEKHLNESIGARCK
ncbi:MAG TPA: hypothetical protein PLY45_04495 [bacterium]|nr:hypothetical protein [bacterium]